MQPENMILVLAIAGCALTSTVAAVLYFKYRNIRAAAWFFFMATIGAEMIIRHSLVG